MWINDAPSKSEDRNPACGGLVLGLVAGVDTGTLGSLEFDAFDRALSHIGLPGEEPTPMPSGTPTTTPTPHRRGQSAAGRSL
jgi:hypothetical protein